MSFLSKHRTKKNTGIAPGVFWFNPIGLKSDRRDLIGLQALLALHDLEAHLLAFLEGLETRTLDCAEVNEHVRAAIAGDKAEALGFVEPLDGTNLTICYIAKTPINYLDQVIKRITDLLEMPKTEGGSSRRSWIRQGEAAAGRMLFKTPEHTQQRHPNRNLGICGIPAENLYPRFMLAAQRFLTLAPFSEPTIRRTIRPSTEVEVSMASGLLKDLKLAMREIFSSGKIDDDQMVSLQVVFGLLGYLARADSIVTDDEAAFLNNLMDDMDLSLSARKIALDSMNRGKARQIDIAVELERFLSVHPAGSPEVGKLYETLLDLAGSDGRVRPREKEFLQQITAGLGFTPDILDSRLEAMARRPIG